MALFTGTQQQYYEGDDYGNYQWIYLDDIITNFIVAYVGEDKLISKIQVREDYNGRNIDRNIGLLGR